MTDNARSSRSACAPIDRDVQRPLLVGSRKRKPQKPGRGRVREPPAGGHHLSEGPRAVGDRPRSTSRHDDTVKRVNNICAAQPIGGHTAGKRLCRGHRLVAEVIGKGPCGSGHAREGAGQGCSRTTRAHSRQIRRKWGRVWRRSALSRQIWRTAPHRGAVRAVRAGRATCREASRRSSCSRGRWGTSRGRARESTSCRTARARACR